MARRNIQVGDDLSGKTLYFEFFDGFYEMLYEANDNIIKTSTYGINQDNVESIVAVESIYRVGLSSGDGFYWCRKSSSGVVEEWHLTEYTLPSDFGVVTSINKNTVSYSRIFIEEIENLNINNKTVESMKINNKKVIGARINNKQIF